MKGFQVRPHGAGQCRAHDYADERQEPCRGDLVCGIRVPSNHEPRRHRHRDGAQEQVDPEQRERAVVAPLRGHNIGSERHQAHRDDGEAHRHAAEEEGLSRFREHLEVLARVQDDPREEQTDEHEAIDLRVVPRRESTRVEEVHAGRRTASQTQITVPIS